MSTQAPKTDPTKPRTLTEADKAAVRMAFDAVRQLPGFKARASQNRMIAIGARALGTTGGGAVVEAPTGVGKSLGYLTAGVPLALAHKRPLIIGTGTVALQEQLVHRDLPRFLEATGLKAKVALAKGRGRYACLRNLADAASGQDEMDLGEMFEPATARPANKDEAALVDSLFTRFDRGEWDGDLDAIEDALPDGVRRRITTTAGGCNRHQCGFADRCPYLLARKAVKEADIVVANHAYILAALDVPLNEAGEHPLLPNPARSLMVLDEAHNLPEEAIDAGASHVHLANHRQQLERSRNALASAYSLAGNEPAANVPPLDAQRAIGQILQDIDALRSALQTEAVPDPTDNQPTWRAPRGVLPENWRALAVGLRDHHATLMSVVEALSGRAKDKEVSVAADHRDKIIRSLGRIAEVLEDGHALWSAWGRQDAQEDAPVARWVTFARDGVPVCHASPVSGAKFLESRVWKRVESTLLCSATLSMGGHFKHFAEDAGIPQRWECASLPTPFDLQANAVLEIPSMRSLPTDADAHTVEVADFVATQLDWSAGNLVLFTSRRQMEQVAQRVPQELCVKLLVQGSRSRTELLRLHAERVKAGTGSTIFGLASFGEGVDLAGDLATTVVIAKLPFATPTDPVGATKSEWFTERNRSAFFEIALPSAQRTLTQFMGRLIRTEADRGRIVLLDRRLVTKRYGKTLLDALPPYRRAIA